MRKFFVCLIISTIFVFVFQNAHATLIDTGDPTQEHGVIAPYLGTYAVAGKFNLTEDSQITSVEWNLVPYYGTGTVTFNLMNDSGYGIPGGIILYSTNPYTVNEAYVAGWYGPTGLDWDLRAGTYWISMQPSSNYYLVEILDSAPNPLPGYAMYSDSPWGPIWGSYEGNEPGYGVRINYDPITTPEPATMLLLGLGLVGLAGIRRKL